MTAPNRPTVVDLQPNGDVAGRSHAPQQVNPDDNLAILQRYAAEPGAARRGPTGEEGAASSKADTQKTLANSVVQPSDYTPEGANPPEITPRNIQQARNIAVNLPTPGSIIFPLLVLIVIWIVVIPYNGKTRLSWLWDMLNGNAVLTGTNSNASGGGADGSTPVVNPVAVTGANSGTGSNNTAVNALLNLFNNTPQTVTDLTSSAFSPSAANLPPPSMSIAITGE